MKYDKDKPKYRFIYTSMMNLVSKVREFGAEKYPNPESWRTTDPTQHFEAAERHVRAVIDGEWIDKESGLPHLAHAICNCMFELERRENGLTKVLRKVKLTKLEEAKVRNMLVGGKNAHKNK